MIIPVRLGTKLQVQRKERREAGKLETWSLQSPRLHDVSSEGQLEDVKAALRAVLTATITETNQVINTTAMCMQAGRLVL